MGVGADCNVFKDSIICKTSQQNCDLLRQKTNYYLNIIRILAFVPVFHISNIELNKFFVKTINYLPFDGNTLPINVYPKQSVDKIMIVMEIRVFNTDLDFYSN